LNHALIFNCVKDRLGELEDNMTANRFCAEHAK